MKTKIIRGLVVGIFVAALANVRASQPPSENVAKKLMALENAWVAALAKADTAALDSILADTYVDTEEGGHRSDKAQTLALLKAGDLKFRSIVLTDMKAYVYGDAAVVTGVAAQNGTFKGESISGTLVFTDTFILEGTTWKAVASQRTTAPK